MNNLSFQPITADGLKAYVSNFNTSVGQIYVVNTTTMTVMKVIASSLLMKATHGRDKSDGLFAGFKIANGSFHLIDRADKSH